MIRGDLILTSSSGGRDRLASLASVIIGTNPAHNTRFPLSNTGEVALKL
ncbi:hypothetical protein I546_0004 [Mycobacterium kansasii 732]|nr:hypothetical protein I546_0004 [Mycobacterium kansasii 732]